MNIIVVIAIVLNIIHYNTHYALNIMSYSLCAMQYAMDGLTSGPTDWPADRLTNRHCHMESCYN